MQAVVVHPGHDTEHAVTCAATTTGLDPAVAETLILPSKTLSPAERLAIYQGMYPMRMYDALAADYPYLLNLLGQDLFEEIVFAYHQKHPSRSFTFNSFGESLPAFLAEYPGLRRRATPARSAPSGRAGIAVDLARLELAFTEAFDAEESHVLTADEIGSVPAAHWEKARLVPVASFRLLELSYAVGPFVDAVKAGRQPPAIRRKASYVAVYRRNYGVYRLDLAKHEHHLLKAVSGGSPLGAALMDTATRFKSLIKPDDLFRAFRDWRGQGMFSRVR